MSLAAALLLVVAAGVGAVRWLRVAQREHYLAGSVSRFEGRWFRARPVNLALGMATAALIVAGVAVPRLWVGAAVGLILWPLGLGLRGQTSKLAWTRRLRTLAAGTAGLARDRAGRHRGVRRLVARRGPGGPGGAAAGGRGRLDPRPDRTTPARPIRDQGQVPPGPGLARRGGHHRVLRQDHDQAVPARPAGPAVRGVRQPGQLQQHRRAGPHDQRAPAPGCGRAHRRDGDVRRGRDRGDVQLDQAPRQRDHGHRPGAPGAAGHDRTGGAGQARDPGRGRGGRAQRGRSASGRAG